MTTDEKDTVSAGTDGSNTEKPGNFDHDSYWKDIIERFFYELLKRAIPELYEKADITAKPRFLNQEFRDILNTGKREIHINAHFADVLAEISLIDGGNACILFHAEAQQGSGGGNFSERMYHYQTLIYAHFRRNPVALAIISGAQRKNERSYAHSHYGTKVSYEYNNLVLFELDDDELKSSDNPIDLALYAAKCASRAKEEHQKLNYMRTLLDLLSERGWSKDDKRDLLLFLERIIDLQDEELEKQYVKYRSQLNEEGKIVYIPLGERELAKEIEQRGVAKGLDKVVKKMLTRGDSPEAIAEIVEWPVERIRAFIN